MRNISRANIGLGTETQLPSSTCCECGTVLDAASGPCRPKEGDLTLCIKCGSLNAFDANLALRKPTDDEIFTVAKDPEFQFMRRTILEMHEDRKKAGRA